jgi:hypothetical protein
MVASAFCVAAAVGDLPPIAPQRSICLNFGIAKVPRFLLQ